MKWLLKKHEEAMKLFEKGGKFEKFYPAFEAHDTLLFTPGHVTKGTTHVRDALDLKRMMVTVVVALLPIVAFAIYNTGLQANTAIAAGAQTLMASFSSWNGDKMHGQHHLLTEVLRGPLGFDGFVVGDWNGHGQVPGCTNAQAAAVILAGVDMIMVPHDWRAFVANTIAQVESGVLPEWRVDEAVTRILRVKMRLGLLGPHTDRGRPSSRRLAGRQDLLGHPRHRAVARQAVRKSLVLLKNRDALLPLSPGQRVLVTGKGAHDLGIQSGGWTLTWQGTETTRDDFPHASTLFEGIS